MAKRRSRAGQARAWTEYDNALWHSIVMLDALDRGDWSSIPDLGVEFARQVEDERIVARTSYDLRTFRPLGDGTYTHDNSTVIATGRGAAPLMIGHAVGRAAGNSSRRRAAAAASVPRWVSEDRGTVFVSTHGFHLMSHLGLRWWNWESIDQCTIEGPGILLLMGRSTDGPISWQVASGLSELIFNLWARVRNPGHWQLTTASWVHPGWAAWASEQGYPLPASTRSIYPRQR